MKNTQTPQPNKGNTKRVNRKSLIVIVLVVLASIGLGAFLSKDLPLRERYIAAVNELEKIKKEVIEPVGSTQLLNEEKRGNGLLEGIFSCGIDVQCPTISAYWYAPIQPGKEAAFLETALQSQGYTATTKNANRCGRISEGGGCSIIGEKGKLWLGVEVRDGDYGDIAVPNTDVSPKIWRVVSLRITDYTR